MCLLCVVCVCAKAPRKWHTAEGLRADESVRKLLLWHMARS